MISQNVICKKKGKCPRRTDAGIKIINGHADMGIYFGSYEVTCNHLHGPPPMWDHNCILYISPSYQELGLPLKAGFRCSAFSREGTALNSQACAARK